MTSPGEGAFGEHVFINPNQTGYAPEASEWSEFIARAEALASRDDSGRLGWESDSIGRLYELHRMSVIDGSESPELRLYVFRKENRELEEVFGFSKTASFGITFYMSMGAAITAPSLSSEPTESAELKLRGHLATHESF